MAASTACGGESGGPEAPRQTFADQLRVGAERCGLGSRDALAALPRGTVAEQVGAIAEAVEDLRGLEQAAEIEPEFVDPVELERRLREKIRRERSRDDIERAQRVGELLAAFPPGFDVAEEITQAVATGVAGFYDPDAREIVVARAGEGELDEYDVSRVAHELEHALVDDAFGLGEGDPRDDWGDSRLAASSLREGSATLTELRVLEALVDRETFQFMLETPAQIALSGLPHLVARMFLFPYTEGLGFVCELYARAGWKAVNAAYRRPPTTSAEILFPERYLEAARTTTPPPLGRLAAPWRLDDDSDGVFGAADLLALFEAPGNDPQRALDRPLRRASAWGGGRVELWEHGSKRALAVALVQRPDSPSLCVSLRTWYGRARPRAEQRIDGALTTFDENDRAAALACRGAAVRFAIGPTAAEARRLLGSGELNAAALLRPGRTLSR